MICLSWLQWSAWLWLSPQSNITLICCTDTETKINLWRPRDNQSTETVKLITDTTDKVGICQSVNCHPDIDIVVNMSNVALKP